MALSQVNQDIMKDLADYDHMKLGQTKYFLIKDDLIEEEIITKVGYTGVRVGLTKNLTGPTYSIIAASGVQAITNNNQANSGLQLIDIDLLSANAGISKSKSHIELKAGLRVVGGELSIFVYNLGVAFDSGIGIKDDSLFFKFFGTGFSFGRRMSYSINGCEFGVDFGKLF